MIQACKKLKTDYAGSVLKLCGYQLASLKVTLLIV